jgi:hypothetical protein
MRAMWPALILKAKDPCSKPVGFGQATGVTVVSWSSRSIKVHLRSCPKSVVVAALALGIITLRFRDRETKAISMSGSDVTGNATGPTLSEIIGSAAFSLSLITGWLYIAGWSYTYDYFAWFRIPLLLVDLPREPTGCAMTPAALTPRQGT